VGCAFFTDQSGLDQSSSLSALGATGSHNSLPCYFLYSSYAIKPKVIPDGLGSFAKCLGVSRHTCSSYPLRKSCDILMYQDTTKCSTSRCFRMDLVETFPLAEIWKRRQVGLYQPWKKSPSAFTSLLPNL